MSNEPTRRRDERGGVPASWFGGDDSVSEHAGERWRVHETRVGMDVNVVKTLGGVIEKSLP